ncbi:hypothetical protein BYT27DRAFT_7188346, partial [Phlegmacium glaucopus]
VTSTLTTITEYKWTCTQLLRVISHLSMIIWSPEAAYSPALASLILAGSALTNLLFCFLVCNATTL